MIKKLKINSTSGVALDATLNRTSIAINGPLVILAHGFQSSKESHTATVLEGRLGALGIDTIRFSFFGHGNSGGTFSEVTLGKGVQDVESVTKFARDTLGYQHISVSGTSFGGAAVLLAAARVDPQYDCVVLKCAVADYLDLENNRLGEHGVEEWLDKGYIEYKDIGTDLPPLRLNSSFYRDLEQNNGLQEGVNIKSATLIVHGDIDDEVPIEQAKELSKKIPNSQLEIIKGAGHRFDEGDTYQQMINLIVEFFKVHLT